MSKKIESLINNFKFKKIVRTHNCNKCGVRMKNDNNFRKEYQVHFNCKSKDGWGGNGNYAFDNLYNDLLPIKERFAKEYLNKLNTWLSDTDSENFRYKALKRVSDKIKDCAELQADVLGDNSCLLEYEVFSDENS